MEDQDKPEEIPVVVCRGGIKLPIIRPGSQPVQPKDGNVE